MRKTIIILILSVLFASCAMHTGIVTNSTALSTNNFAYVKKSVQGTAKATYFLRFGGLSRQALVEEARRDLLENYMPEDNQALVNLTSALRLHFCCFIWKINVQCQLL